jgi:hypothetical protein
MRAEPIAKTLQAVFEGLSAPKKDPRQEVCGALVSLLDEEEKKHVKPWKLESGVLTLHIDSPARMFALNLKKARLLQQLRERIKPQAVKEIRLRIGALK